MSAAASLKSRIREVDRLVQAKDLVTKCLRLVTLPDVYLRAKSVLDDPDSGAVDMARAIAHDPGMAARLLRIANSAFFGFAAKIDSIPRAVSLLGTQQIHDLVLATSLASTFKGVRSEVMDMDKFWHDSVYRAVAAKLLAAHCNVLDAERLFVAGLLADIGHLLMYGQIPEQAQAAAQAAAAECRPLQRVEQELLGFNYADVGGELLAAWRLPDSLEQTVRHHAEPAHATDFALETCIVHIATALNAMTVNAEDEAIDGGAAHLTGCDERLLAELAEEVDRQVADTVALIFSSPHRKSA